MIFNRNCRYSIIRNPTFFRLVIHIATICTYTTYYHTILIIKFS